MKDNARDLVQKFSGPLATAYGCPFCNHVLRFKHVGNTIRAGTVGRGYGLRMGGTLHSQMGAHIRAEHPDKVTRT
jgi:hypothetical protein